MKALVVDAEWAPRDPYRPSDRERREQRAVIGSEVWRAPHWQVAEREIPSVSDRDHVLVRVRACGVCGADVHMYETDPEGYMLLAYRTKLPVAVGHEFCGEIVDLGADVKSLAVGEAVAIEGMSYCGRCRACKRGLINSCPHGEDLGFTLDGGAEEYVLVRESQCCSLNSLRERFDDDQVFEVGALIEPTSVVYHALFVRAGGFEPGIPVVVFGCGPIGLAAVQLVRAGGAGEIIAVDVQPERRRLAETCGAEFVIDPRAGDVAERILELTRGRGAGLLVEGSGAGKAVFPTIDRCLDFGAKVVVVGVDPAPAPVNLVAYQVKGAQIVGSIGHLGGGFDAAIDLHAQGRIDMSPIVTGRYPLSDGVRAIERTAERVDAKVLIKP